MAPDPQGISSSAMVDPVPVSAIAMKLLDVRLKPSGAIISSVMGEFTAPSRHEIVVLRAGGMLELHSIVTTSPDDEEEPRTFLKLITRMETRSVLRSCAVVRLTGGKRDVLAVGADGGAISVLDLEGGRVKVVHCMIFGKTGACSRGWRSFVGAVRPALLADLIFGSDTVSGSLLICTCLRGF